MRTHERINGLLKSPYLLWNTMVNGNYEFIYDRMPVRMNRMSPAKRLNLTLSGMNMIHRRLTPWSMPLHMQFELTNYCNLRCPVCPTGIRAMNRKKQAMSVDLFKKIIDQVGPTLLTASLWAWGEPLMHPHLEEILAVASQYRFATFLSTNGQNLDNERVIQALINYPPTYLIVALDGLTDDTNSQFRVGARLAPALNGVRRLAELKKKTGQPLPVLHMRFIVMKHNEHEVAALEKFAADHQFDFLTVRTLSIIDIDTQDHVHQSLLPEQDGLKAYNYKDKNRLKKRDYYCLEPFWFPTVFADGTLVPCEQDYNAKTALGKIDEATSFRELWYNDATRSVRRHIRDCPDDISFCRNCPYRDRETTDCSIHAFPINKTIDFKSLV